MRPVATHVLVVDAATVTEHIAVAAPIVLLVAYDVPSTGVVEVEKAEVERRTRILERSVMDGVKEVMVTWVAVAKSWTRGGHDTSTT